MRAISVPMNQLPGMFRRFGAVSKRNTEGYLPRVVERVKHIVTVETARASRASPNGRSGAIDTGNYLRSWQVNPATIDGVRGVLITNLAKYMAVIERGRTAGAKAPPVSVIASWAQRRLGLPYKEARNAAWPIAMAIKRRGLYARRVMTGNPAKNSYRNTMREVMGMALDEASIRVFS